MLYISYVNKFNDTYEVTDSVSGIVSRFTLEGLRKLPYDLLKDIRGYNNYRHMDVADSLRACPECVALEAVALRDKIFGRVADYKFDGLGYIFPILNAGCFELPEWTQCLCGAAFIHNRRVTKIVCNKNLKIINTLAFDARQELCEIELNDGLERICGGAFKNTRIKSITIPDSVKSLGELAFAQAEYLEEVKLPNSLQEIPRKCFAWCKRLKSVTFPDMCTSIGSGAFRGTKLEHIELPDGLLSIDEEAFCNCRMLNNVIVPESCTVIHSGAFANCDDLENLKLPKRFSKSLERITTKEDKVF